jgi:hypothetical protein
MNDEAGRNTATRARFTGSAIRENRAARRREEASWRARAVTGIPTADRRDAPRYRHPRVGSPENSSVQPGGRSEAGATGDLSPSQPARVISANAKAHRHTRREWPPALMPPNLLRLVEGAGFRPIRCSSNRSARATRAVWQAGAGSARSRSSRAPLLMRLAVSRHR